MMVKAIGGFVWTAFCGVAIMLVNQRMGSAGAFLTTVGLALTWGVFMVLILTDPYDENDEPDDDFTLVINPIGGSRGNNWRTNPQIYGNPNGAGAGAQPRAFYSLPPGGNPFTTPSLASRANLAGNPEPRRAIENAGIVLGVTVGYRAWLLGFTEKATDMASAARLRSMAVDAAWQPGTPMDTHEKPIVDYGVHAFKTLGQAIAYSAGQPAILGEVSLWGTIIEHEDGYRAEHAYPRKLLASAWGGGTEAERLLLAQLNETYGLAA